MKIQSDPLQPFGASSMKFLKTSFYTKLLLFILFSFIPTLAHAHALRLSNSDFQWSPPSFKWDFQIHQTDYDLKMKEMEEAVAKEYLLKRLFVSQPEGICTLNDLQIIHDPAKELVSLHATGICPSETSSIQISYGLFFGDFNHKHLIKFIHKNHTQSVTLSPENPEAKFEVGGGPENEILSFLKLGFEHILSGFDHILFIFSLILAAARLKDLVLLATTFTFAHSISLALAVFDWVNLSPSIVEPLIAASIVFVAVKTLVFPQPNLRFQLLIVFLFGLIHGLGFSGALKEASLQNENLAIPLIFFNLGVEGGQVLFIAGIYPLLLLLRSKWTQRSVMIQKVSLAAIALMGMYWMVTRVF